MEAPRPPRPEEMEGLNRLTQVCFGFGGPPQQSSRRRLPVPAGARVIVDNGMPVSHIHMVFNTLSLHGTLVKVVSFGGVCTHPEYRKQGLASQLLTSCMQEAVAAKATLLIISGMRGLYRRAHAVPCGPVWEAVLRPAHLSSTPTTLSVRRAGPEDWPLLARLHQAEPVRFVRSAQWYARAFTHPHRHVWVMERAGELLASCSLSRVWDVHHDASVRALGEYAGSRTALLDGLAALFAEEQLSELRVAFPQHDHEFHYLCQSRGLTLTPGTIPDHTVRLLQLPELMRTLRPYALARLSPREWRHLTVTQTEESCQFIFEDESREVNFSKAGALILGGPGAPRLTGKLGALLSRLFPLPFPLPGLNYV